jgi:hypothetical protein
MKMKLCPRACQKILSPAMRTKFPKTDELLRETPVFLRDQE